MSELRELEAQMLEVVKRRAEKIGVAQAIIDKANRDFDEQAAPLGRRINELRKVEAATTNGTPAKRKLRPPNMEGLTEEEQEHFLKLRGNNARA